MSLLRDIGRRLGAVASVFRMPRPAPFELPDDWLQTLEEDEREYLYEEFRRRLQETLDFGKQQEEKVFALARVALLIFAASGIFRVLHFEIASLGEGGAVTIASSIVVLVSLLVGWLTFVLWHPRDWETGANIEWLAKWSSDGANEQQMKGAILKVFVEGFHKNSEVVRARGERLPWLLRAVTFQTICVVAVQVVAAAEAG